MNLTSTYIFVWQLTQTQLIFEIKLNHQPKTYNSQLIYNGRKTLHESTHQQGFKFKKKERKEKTKIK